MPTVLPAWPPRARLQAGGRAERAVTQGEAGAAAGTLSPPPPPGPGCHGFSTSRASVSQAHQGVAARG